MRINSPMTGKYKSGGPSTGFGEGRFGSAFPNVRPMAGVCKVQQFSCKCDERTYKAKICTGKDVIRPNCMIDILYADIYWRTNAHKLMGQIGREELT